MDWIDDDDRFAYEQLDNKKEQLQKQLDRGLIAPVDACDDLDAYQIAQSALEQKAKIMPFRTPKWVLNIQYYTDYGCPSLYTFAYGNCPRCNEDVDSAQNYCPHCGQALEWPVIRDLEPYAFPQ